MANIDEVLGGLQPQTAVARLCLRGDLLAEVDQLEHRLADARRLDETENRAPVAPQLQQQLDTIKQQARDAETVFRFQALGRRAWRELIAKHPPTKQQLELDPGLDHNPDTFVPAAIAASCVDPEGMTAEKVDELGDVLSVGQFNRLWAACCAVNIAERDAPK